MALQKTWRWFGKTDEVKLSDLKQIGVEGIVTALYDIPTGEVWSVEKIQTLKNEIEDWGMEWSVVESLGVSEEIKLNTPEARQHLENYKTSVRNLAHCGINIICYNFMPVLDWARTDLQFIDDNGCESMLFEYIVFAVFDIYILKREGADKDYSEEVVKKANAQYQTMSEQDKRELAHNIIVVTQKFINSGVGDVENYKEKFLQFLKRYNNVDRDILRNNLMIFLNEIIPVAEECGVRLCIHPDDPPFPLLGLPRIASTEEDLEWIFSENTSLSNGLTYCSGSLSVKEENNLENIAEKFAERIHFIHLRNIKKIDDKSFYESAHLDGVVNMPALIHIFLKEQKRRKAEGRKDYQLPFRPDHGLKMLDDFSRTANPGYPLIGRMKGLAEIDGIQKAIENKFINIKEYAKQF